MSQLSSHAAELKSQGAEEAARDPNSSVTSQDAQRVILDETKKAGGAAFSFNPNASPEEKAAVARAVRYTQSGLFDNAHLLSSERARRLSP